MATAVHMQPPTSRPSMDRPTSFDQPRSRSTPPFSSHHGHYDARSPSPNVQRPHSRTSSNASASSPYNQPFANSYFPAQGQIPSLGVGMHHPQAWTANAIPATAFYPSPMQLHPGQSFQQGFQQSQADFAAWATAYHQMVAASMASGNHINANQNGHQGMMPPQPEYLGGERRRTNSGPSTSTPFSHSQSFYEYNAHNPHAHDSAAQRSGQQPSHSSKPFHAHQRTPSYSSPRENLTISLPRSVSQPSLSPTESRHSPAVSSVASPPQEHHRRTASFESGGPRASVVAPPRVASRTDSFSSDAERTGRSTPTAASRTSSPAPSARVVSSATTKATVVHDRPKAPQPLHSGPIANATNTPNPGAFNRPSPLSQTTTHADSEKMKGGGLKSRLKKVLDKDATTPKKQSTTPSVISKASGNKPVFASPSETSTRSATPPTTPPQLSDLPPPSRPFVSHPQALDSEISLADTERTATGPNDTHGPTGKQKRSLFRMKNMSTDNISLSSTVSSASMMIRKMGSIGKIARRNR